MMHGGQYTDVKLTRYNTIVLLFDSLLISINYWNSADPNFKLAPVLPFSVKLVFFNLLRDSPIHNKTPAKETEFILHVRYLVNVSLKTWVRNNNGRENSNL